MWLTERKIHGRTEKGHVETREKWHVAFARLTSWPCTSSPRCNPLCETCCLTRCLPLWMKLRGVPACPGHIMAPASADVYASADMYRWIRVSSDVSMMRPKMISMMKVCSSQQKQLSRVQPFRHGKTNLMLCFLTKWNSSQNFLYYEFGIYSNKSSLSLKLWFPLMISLEFETNTNLTLNATPNSDYTAQTSMTTL